MANNNLDPVHLAKRVSNQLVSFPRGKSLQSKIEFMKWMYENENFGGCCKMIIDGATVVLKVEEKLSEMEARVKNGEGGERLRLKVENVRRKIERYHILMHLLVVSKNPGEFAACVRNFNSVRKDWKLGKESFPKGQVTDFERIPPKASKESQPAENVEKTPIKEKVEFEEGSKRQHMVVTNSASEDNSASEVNSAPKAKKVVIYF